jgi:hypothetical protein
VGTKIRTTRPRTTSPVARSVGLGLGAIGAPAFSASLDPILGQMLVMAEVGALLVVVFAALFATRHISERAFRLLRWCSNRPEPPAPDRTADLGSSHPV